MTATLRVELFGGEVLAALIVTLGINATLDHISRLLSLDLKRNLLI
jgi:hypothetical protein